jgi:hypothetical protein
MYLEIYTLCHGPIFQTVTEFSENQNVRFELYIKEGLTGWNEPNYYGESVNRSQMEVKQCNGRNRLSIDMTR